MKSFFQVCKETEEKLGRKLQEREIVFLKWMHERYLEEKNKGTNQEEECLN